MTGVIDLSITREDLNRVIFKDDVTWDEYIVESNHGFTYVTFSGEIQEYTVPSYMRYFLQTSMLDEIRGLAEAAVILDYIKSKGLDDSQLISRSTPSVGMYEFEILGHIEDGKLTAGKVRKFCERLLGACADMEIVASEKLSAKFAAATVVLTEEDLQKINLYHFYADRPFDGLYPRHRKEDLGFSITHAGKAINYTLRPDQDSDTVWLSAFEDRRYALAALAAYKARAAGVDGKFVVKSWPDLVDPELLENTQDYIQESAPESVLTRLGATWRIQEF